MYFQQIVDGGCQSYIVACPESCAAIVIDPALAHIDRYIGLIGREGLRLRYIIETHTPCRSLLGSAAVARAKRRADRHAPGRPCPVRTDTRWPSAICDPPSSTRRAIPPIRCVFTSLIGSLPATRC